MALKYCQQCGVQIEETVVFCPSCGTQRAVEAGSGSLPSQPQPTAGPVNQPYPNPYQPVPGPVAPVLGPSPVGQPIQPQPTAGPVNQPYPNSYQPVPSPVAPVLGPSPVGQPIQPQPYLPKDKSFLPKRIFLVLSGLTGLIVVVILGLLVFNFFTGGVDKALAKIGVECQLKTVDTSNIEDSDLLAIAGRTYECSLEVDGHERENKYGRLSLKDYQLLLDKSSDKLKQARDWSDDDLRRECSDVDPDDRINIFDDGSLVVGSYVFSAAGSFQIKQLKEALEAEGVKSQPSQTTCERVTG